MINFKVMPDDGEPFEITANSRDIYVWERTHRGKTLGSVIENQPIADLYEIAHQAMRNQRGYAGTLQEFIDTHLIDKSLEPQADPTQPTP